MSNLKLEITSTAICDIEKIADYIALDNKSAACKMVRLFHKTFKILSVHPQLGREREDFTYMDVKFYVVQKNYLVVYNQPNQMTLRILRVLPAYQDICALL